MRLARVREAAALRQRHQALLAGDAAAVAPQPEPLPPAELPRCGRQVPGEQQRAGAQHPRRLSQHRLRGSHVEKAQQIVAKGDVEDAAGERQRGGVGEDCGQRPRAVAERPLGARGEARRRLDAGGGHRPELHALVEDQETAAAAAADLQHAVVGLHQHLAREVERRHVRQHLAGHRLEAAPPPRADELLLARCYLFGGHRRTG